MDNIVFDDGQYYVYPQHRLHELIHSFWNFEEAPHTIPVISVVGAGPQGPRGEKGDAGKISFGRDDEDSAIWDNSKPYEKNTFVVQGEHIYVAIQNVPAGILIDNETYWRRYDFTTTGIESLRHDLDAEIANRQAGDSDEATLRAQGDAELSQSIADETSARQIEDSDLSRRINNEVDARIAGDSANATAVSDETLARQQGDADLQTQIDNVYTKLETDSLFSKKTFGSNDVLVCVGDSLLQGYSQENPSGITAWDFYLAKALGFNTINVVKIAAQDSGFVVGQLTLSQLLNSVATQLSQIGKTADDVALVCCAGGLNDMRNYSDTVNSNFGPAVAAFASQAESMFPNADIHIFPMLMGNFGYSDRVARFETYASQAVTMQNADSNTKTRSFVHKGVWSWNYDGNDAGVSTDHVNLLAKGEKLAGESMAMEIKGISAFNWGTGFEVHETTSGTTKAYGYRNGSVVSYRFWDNFASASSDGHNTVWWIDPRYGYDAGVINLATRNGEAYVFYYDMTTQSWCSFDPMASTMIYGTVTYNIETFLS